MSEVKIAEAKKVKKIGCVVVSDKMNKSRVGKIERVVKHPVVGKYIRKSTRIMFHDEENTTKIGDEVLVEECRPMSANKSFRLHSIRKRAEV